MNAPSREQRPPTTVITVTVGDVSFDVDPIRDVKAEGLAREVAGLISASTFPVPVSVSQHRYEGDRWVDAYYTKAEQVMGRVASEVRKAVGAPPRVWRMHCHKMPEDHPTPYMDFGHTSYVRAHGTRHPMIEVDLVEDPDGMYLGWIDYGPSVFSDERPDTPAMIEHHRIFDIQFTYGHRAEVRALKGEAVGLRVEEVTR